MAILQGPGGGQPGDVSHGLLNIVGVQGVEIRGFTVQHSAADGINGRQGAAFTVRDVRVLQSADDGIEATETSTVRFLGTCEIRAAVVKMALRSPMAPVRCSVLSTQQPRMFVGDLCHWDIDRRVRHWHGTHHPEHLRDPHPGTLESDAGPQHADHPEQNTLDGIGRRHVRPPARWRDDQRHPECAYWARVRRDGRPRQYRWHHSERAQYRGSEQRIPLASLS